MADGLRAWLIIHYPALLDEYDCYVSNGGVPNLEAWLLWRNNDIYHDWRGRQVVVKHKSEKVDA